MAIIITQWKKAYLEVTHSSATIIAIFIN